jgi:hypothetical protein
MRKHWELIMIGFVLVFLGCKKEEKTILRGTIEGKITLIDQHFDNMNNHAGVEVSLSSDTVVRHTQTDAGGIFSFPDLPYGTYHVLYHKPGFVKYFGNYSFDVIHHVGGYSDTRAMYSLYQIPTFQLTVDSIVNYMYSQNSTSRPRFYGTMSEPGKASAFYAFRCFASNSPDVSKDSYSVMLFAYSYTVNKKNICSLISGDIYKLTSLQASAIYFKIYPEAFGQYRISFEA